MESSTLPEIRAITQLITELRGYTNNAQPAVVIISNLFSSTKGVTPTEGFLELMRTVSHLPTLVADLPQGGPQRVGEKVVERIGRLFDPALLAVEVRAYVVKNEANFEYIEDSIHIFSDMGFDADAFAAKTADLYDHIEKMKTKFGGVETLSDASKTVLFAQLELLRNSVHRFQTSGVSAFRDSVFSIYGRVVIQLEADKSVSDVDKRGVIDDFLRFYDLSQAAGSLLKLGAPFIAGLLTHAS